MSKLTPINKCVDCRYHENGACFHPKIVFDGIGRWAERAQITSFPSWCPLPAAPEENAIPKTECRINQWKGTQKP